MRENGKLCDDIDCRVFSSEDKKSEYPLYVTDNIRNIGPTVYRTWGKTKELA